MSVWVRVCACSPLSLSRSLSAYFDHIFSLQLVDEFNVIQVMTKTSFIFVYFVVHRNEHTIVYTKNPLNNKTEKFNYWLESVDYNEYSMLFYCVTYCAFTLNNVQVEANMFRLVITPGDTLQKWQFNVFKISTWVRVSVCLTRYRYSNDYNG